VRNNTANNLSDKELVDKILGGDTGVFKTVIKNTEGLVAQIIFKMINNSRDRKDLAQDVYLKAFKELRSFKFQAKLSTWIGQITYNTCLNYIQKKKLILIDNIASEGDHQEEAIVMLSDRQVDIFENETHSKLSENEISSILTTEIDKLSPLYKTLITLYHNEEMSYTDICQITQLPEGTVKNYLFRARKMLRENLLMHHKKDEL
jgi:RNA polymerase sigma factor (sigma-70 family)